MGKGRLSQADRGRVVALAIGLVIGILAGEQLRVIGAVLLGAIVVGIAYVGLRTTIDARRAPAREHEPAA